MLSADSNAMDEDAIFEAEFREDDEPSRKPVVLRTKIKATSKEKQANKSRFEHRTSRDFRAKSSGRNRK